MRRLPGGRLIFDSDDELRTFIERAKKEQLCFWCGEPYDTQVQVGRCIYNEPCGHRHGQGRLR